MGHDARLRLKCWSKVSPLKMKNLMTYLSCFDVCMRQETDLFDDPSDLRTFKGGFRSIKRNSQTRGMTYHKGTHYPPCIYQSYIFGVFSIEVRNTKIQCPRTYRSIQYIVTHVQNIKFKSQSKIRCTPRQNYLSNHA